MLILILGATLTAASVVLVLRFADRAFGYCWDEVGISVYGGIFGFVVGFIIEMIMISYNATPAQTVLGAPAILLAIMMVVIGACYAFGSMDEFMVKLGDIARTQRSSLASSTVCLIALGLATVTCGILYFAGGLSLDALPLAIPGGALMYLGMLVLLHKIGNQTVGRD
jgi:hypothetical protein